MENPLVLTFDIGTQSARGLLVKKDGSFLDVCTDKYDEPYYSRNPGWAEQRPDFYYDKICDLAKQLTEKNKDRLSDIIAVTVTVIRDTVLCLDKNNEPLRDIILWLDKRQADFNNPFPLSKKLMFQLVGMTDATKILYKASPCNWIMQKQPEIWNKTAKYVLLPTYLNYKMTGQLADSQANMIGHIPYDYKNRTWKTKGNLSRCVCDVPFEKSCDKLLKSGEVIGTLTKEFCEKTGLPEGLQLIATGSDKGCETLGLSVVESNKAAISYGTTATIQMAVKKYFEPQQFMPAYPAVPNDLFNPEIEIYRGFWMLSWFIKEFGAQEKIDAEAQGISPEQLLDKYIEKIPPCCDGLLLQPYWTPGAINPTSKGCIVGFADYHTHYHMYRAIIEGIVFELYSSLLIMQKRSGYKIDEVYVGGGGSKSDIVCQITADIIGLPVKRTVTHEACSVGASMVAYIAKGIYKDYDEAIKNMVHEKDTFMPDSKNHELYMQYYNKAYVKIFPSLEPVYKKIIKLLKKEKES